MNAGDGSATDRERYALNKRRYLHFSAFAILTGPVFLLLAFLGLTKGYRPLFASDIYPWAYFFGLPCMLALVLVCGLYLLIAQRFRLFETAVFALFIPPLVFSALFLEFSNHSVEWSGFPRFFWGWLKYLGITSLFAAVVCWGLSMLSTRRGGKAALP